MSANPLAWAAAQIAANTIVGGTAEPSVVRAVLAQWISESGWSWPSPRFNPGSVAVGWAQATGYPYTIPQPNPQPTDPIVAFPDQDTGCKAYAKGFSTIRNSNGTLKYQAAVDAAKAGDGLGFAQATLAQHYGTSLATWDSVNAMLLAEQQALEGWIDEGDRMIFSGYSGAITTRFRYPIVTGQALYMGTADDQYLKTYQGAPGSTKFLGPVGQKWSDPAWKWGAVLIGTAAADPAGTVVYIKNPDKAKVIDTLVKP